MAEAEVLTDDELKLQLQPQSSIATVTPTDHDTKREYNTERSAKRRRVDSAGSESSSETPKIDINDSGISPAQLTDIGQSNMTLDTNSEAIKEEEVLLIVQLECNICHRKVRDLAQHLQTDHFDAHQKGDENESQPTSSSAVGNPLDLGIALLTGTCGSCNRVILDLSLHQCDLSLERNPRAMTQEESDEEIIFGPEQAIPSPVRVESYWEPYEGSVLNPSTGRHKCRRCPKEYATDRDVQRHHDNAHRKVRFKCGVCGREFISNSSYSNHYVVKHT